MRWIDWAHRWTGGWIGLLLALLGFSGTLLLYKDAWMRAVVSHAAELPLQDRSSLMAAAEHLLADVSSRPNSLTFPTDQVSLFRLSFTGGRGAYADASGTIVERWASNWDRPELWLFDFHHHLWLGDVGIVASGILALVGLGFVITGFLLWWRNRKAFALRLLPARLSRLHIVRHHRDIGVIATPLLIVVLLSGAMLTLRPVADLVLAPWSAPGTIATSLAPPRVSGGPLATDFDWRKTLETVSSTYPEAELRTISVPSVDGQLVRIRVRQPTEWLPNGRTVFWFDPADGRLIEVRDAGSLPPAARMFNLVYPIHASTVGGITFKVAMTFAGIVLTMLGTLSVFGFWGYRSRLRSRSR